MKAGDILIVHFKDENFVDKSISFFEGSPWQHAAIVTSTSGDIVESVDTGVRKNNVAFYGDDLTMIRTPHIPFSPDEQQKIVDKADTFVGHPYGFLDIAALAVRLGLEKIGLKAKPDFSLIPFTTAEFPICSQLVTLAIRAARPDFLGDALARNVTPAMLATAEF